MSAASWCLTLLVGSSKGIPPVERPAAAVSKASLSGDQVTRGGVARGIEGRFNKSRVACVQVRR